MYQIVIPPKAFHSLESLDSPTGKRILDKLSWFSENFDDLTPLPLRGALGEVPMFA